MTSNNSAVAATMISTVRPDGRSSGGTLRPLSCELSPLSRADGSALWKAGSTQILAAVYGPIAPQRMSVEQQEGAVISVIFNGGYRQHESLLTKIVEGCVCLQEYKRCVIEIVLQSINDDGAVLSCSLHAIVAALMDAGVAMNYIPIATTIALAEDDAAVLLDPCQEEEDQAAYLTIISSNSEPERLLGSVGGGGLSLEQLLSCQEAAARANPAVLAFMRLAIEQKVTRQAKTIMLASNQ